MRQPIDLIRFALPLVIEGVQPNDTTVVALQQNRFLSTLGAGHSEFMPLTNPSVDVPVKLRAKKGNVEILGPAASSDAGIKRRRSEEGVGRGDRSAAGEARISVVGEGRRRCMEMGSDAVVSP